VSARARNTQNEQVTFPQISGPADQSEKEREEERKKEIERDWEES